MSQSQSGSQSGSVSPSIPQTAAAGSVVITQPPQSSTSYYKIAPSQLITFGWNYTDVIVTPTSLTISAICEENGNTYAVGPTDGIIDGTETTVIWDVYSYQQANPGTPLAQGTYTLSMWDDRGPDATRRAGYMAPNSNLKFALYTPQGYTAISDGWRCTTCNSASSLAAHPAFLAISVSFLVMLLSGLRVLRQR